jgi:UDP-2-acetamido-3-amino-2,3-dideoxy-glucuronate N-acetyltransferase
MKNVNADRRSPAAEVTEPAGHAAQTAEGPDHFVHKSSYVDEGARIGRGTKVWHFSHIQKGAAIGENCSIGQNVNVAPNVRIGSNVKIQNNVSVYEGVELEDFVFCGPSMVFTNILNPRSEFPQRGSDHYVRTLVKQGASLGANSTIVCGTTIGRYAFVGAGSVVTRDVPEYGLVVGSPARILGWICRCGQRLTFPKDDGSGPSRAKCPACARSYAKENRTVRILSEKP